MLPELIVTCDLFFCRVCAPETFDVATIAGCERFLTWPRADMVETPRQLAPVRSFLWAVAIWVADAAELTPVLRFLTWLLVTLKAPELVPATCERFLVRALVALIELMATRAEPPEPSVGFALVLVEPAIMTCDLFFARPAAEIVDRPALAALARFFKFDVAPIVAKAFEVVAGARLRVCGERIDIPLEASPAAVDLRLVWPMAKIVEFAIPEAFLPE